MISKIEISYKTIVFVVAFLGLVWVIIYIRDILFLLFISFILMSALRPLVEFFEKFRIPRAVSIISVYIIVFGLFGVVFSSLVPAFVVQTSKLISSLPRYLSVVNQYVNIDIRSLTSQIAPISENIVKVTFGFFSNILAVMTVLVFTFYLLLERIRLVNYIKAMVDRAHSDTIIKTIENIETNLGNWLRGQLFLMFLIGFITYLGLLFLKVEFALPLAILAGLFEIIPVIGPIVSAVPAVIIAATTSPFLGLSTIALYFIIQQLENQVVVPVVMNRAVGLSPLIIILSLMIGSRLGGIMGAILSIPLVIVARTIIKAIINRK